MGANTLRVFSFAPSCFYNADFLSLRKGQWHYQWRLAEVCCLLVENYSNSRQVWSSRSFLQFLWGPRPNNDYLRICQMCGFGLNLTTVIQSNPIRHAVPHINQLLYHMLITTLCGRSAWNGNTDLTSLTCYHSMSPADKLTLISHPMDQIIVNNAYCSYCYLSPIITPSRSRGKLTSRITTDTHHWIPFGDHPLKLERYRED